MAGAADTPLYGRRLVPVLIDERAESNPTKLFCEIPVSNDLKDGFKIVTYADLARGINRAAAWLEGKFGKSESFETLAYMGVFDLRYLFICIAAGKIGWKTLLPSPRNSLEAQLNLFKLTETKVVLTPKGYPILPGLLSEARLEVTYVPELENFMALGEVKKYTFVKTFDEAKWDPFLIFHTSGTSGLPKPIITNHGWLATLDSQQNMPKCDGYGGMWPSQADLRIITPFPPFHAGGFSLLLLIPLSYNMVVVWSPPNIPPSAVLVEELLSIVNVDAAYLPPSIIEDMVRNPAALAKLEKLSVIGHGGGPLPNGVGEKLWDKVELRNLLGATECLAPPLYAHHAKDWEYFHYNPELKGVEFRPVGDGTFEQFLVRHPSTDDFHGNWYTFPDLQEYSMNDLYRPHPTKPNLWLYVGRADDIIVLSNGEKLNPVSMEGILREHAYIEGALVVGQARFSPAVIIEVTPKAFETLKTPEDKASFIEESIWPLAVKANKDAPAHAQLSQDRIMLSTPGKPFLRAGKGTMQRAGTVKLYAEEIDLLYQRSDADENAVQSAPYIDIGAETEIVELEIGKLIESVLGLKQMAKDQDFFAAGMDSLHVMRIAKKLKASIMGDSHDHISTRTIYLNPTIEKLVVALKDMAATNPSPDGNATSREQLMQETLASFVKQLPALNTKKVQPKGAGHTVLLTGSTGSLGSYLLHTLLESSNVTKVYCLNRRVEAKEQQSKANASRGLISKWDDKVEFLHADLRKQNFGLEESAYKRLEKQTSVIIHNQWQVDFNLSLPSFSPHITGTLNLIKLSSASPKSPPIFFTSSIGTVGSWAKSHGQELVPEVSLSDPSIPAPGGYSESKWIAERLFDEAGKQSGLVSAVLRVGQIAGPVEVGVKGVWNKAEWLPSIVASSKYLGVIPDTLPGQDEIPWVPVDILAKVILDLIESSPSIGHNAWTSYFHLANPQESSWKKLVPFIQEYYSKKASAEGINIKVIPFDEWVEKLAESGQKPDLDLDKNPAVKLLDFYQGLSKGSMNVKLSTEKAKEKSETLRKLKSVNPEWMKLWLEQWSF